jgi:hypothetical protein
MSLHTTAAAVQQSTVANHILSAATRYTILPCDSSGRAGTSNSLLSLDDLNTGSLSTLVYHESHAQ